MTYIITRNGRPVVEGRSLIEAVARLEDSEPVRFAAREIVLMDCGETIKRGKDSWGGGDGTMIESLALMVMPLPHTALVSWYGEPFHGRITASGAVYDMHDMTAAHRSLPFGAVVRLQCGARGCTVTITDRGPFVDGREFDLSRAAFLSLASLETGLVWVQWEVVYVPEEEPE